MRPPCSLCNRLCLSVHLFVYPPEFIFVAYEIILLSECSHNFVRMFMT
jgi:hypothetical protein